jgi:ribosome biogenesis GTPase
LSDYPAVGDFVMLDRNDDAAGNAIIHHVLTRKSAFIRKAAGTANEEQVVAANIDTVFICMALNNDYNLRRVERYLSIAWDSGAVPVIVLTKADLCEDLPGKLKELETVACGVECLLSSSLSEDGCASVLKYLGRGADNRLYRFVRCRQVDLDTQAAWAEHSGDPGAKERRQG